MNRIGLSYSIHTTRFRTSRFPWLRKSNEIDTQNKKKRDILSMGNMSTQRLTDSERRKKLIEIRLASSTVNSRLTRTFAFSLEELLFCVAWHCSILLYWWAIFLDRSIRYWIVLWIGLIDSYLRRFLPCIFCLTSCIFCFFFFFFGIYAVWVTIIMVKKYEKLHIGHTNNDKSRSHKQSAVPFNMKRLKEWLNEARSIVSEQSAWKVQLNWYLLAQSYLICSFWHLDRIIT